MNQPRVPASPRLRVRLSLYIAILAVGLTLRLWNIHERSVWTDEGHSMAFVHAPLGEMNRFLALDDHPPLYYWLLRLWLAPGGNVAWARIFSALCSAAALPLAYVMGRRLSGLRAGGLIAMALLAVSPHAIYYGQELRMYGLQSLFVAGMMVAALAAFRRPGPERLAAATTLGVLACYTHYFSGIFMVGFMAAGPWTRRKDESGAGPAVVRTALLALLSVVLYMPWLYTGMGHTLANLFGGLWAGGSGPPGLTDLVGRVFETTLGFRPAFPFDRLLMADPRSLSSCRIWTVTIFSMALFALFLLGLARLRRNRSARLFLAAFLAVPLIVSLAFEACGGRFYARFLVPMLPLGFACVAVGILAIKRLSDRWAVGFVLGAVMLASAFSGLKYDIRDVSRDVAHALDSARAAAPTSAMAKAPVLHANAHSFWDLMAYDATPGRHRLLALPGQPALARLIFGEEVLVTARELEKYNCVWAVYSEWSANPPVLRRRIERQWFAEGWVVSGAPFFAQRGIKKMELVCYIRHNGGRAK
jgi:4-amino-4-deoxy-L-arabinose transferase-like glycosyltransferase